MKIPYFGGEISLSFAFDPDRRTGNLRAHDKARFRDERVDASRRLAGQRTNIGAKPGHTNTSWTGFN